MARVFATRPAQQNPNWAARLCLLGCDVEQVSLLDIVEVSGGARAQAQTKIAQLDEYQKVIFVSQNAVRFALVAMDECWPQLPVRLQWFAVGQRTAAQLQEGLDTLGAHDAIVMGGGAKMNSETLLALPGLAQVANQKILIIRGQGGRPLIAEELELRGATVEYCELYARELPADCAKKLAQIEFLGNDVLPVFSIETLDNFVAAVELDQLTENKRDAVLRLNLVLPSERVHQRAIEYGFTHTYIAETAAEDAMLTAIKHVLDA